MQTREESTVRISWLGWAVEQDSEFAMNAGNDEETQDGGQNSGEQIDNREQDEFGEVMKLDYILDEMFNSLKTAYAKPSAATQAPARLKWKATNKPAYDWDLLYQDVVASHGPALQKILGNTVGALVSIAYFATSPSLTE
jgi:hypothetical protein